MNERRDAGTCGEEATEPCDPVEVSLGACDASWYFWETEYPDDMVIGPFDSEEACRSGVEDFYQRNNPFSSGQTAYVITHVITRVRRRPS